MGKIWIKLVSNNVLVRVIFLIVALLNNVKVDKLSFPGIKIGKKLTKI